MTDTPFRRVYEHATAKLPVLAARNTSVIHVWLTNGCDPESEKNPTIGGFAYFTTAVMKARNERIKAEEVFNPPEKVGFEDHEKAKRIAWSMRKAGMYHSEHAAWLASYEAIHGRVEV